MTHCVPGPLALPSSVRLGSSSSFLCASSLPRGSLPYRYPIELNHSTPLPDSTATRHAPSSRTPPVLGQFPPCSERRDPEVRDAYLQYPWTDKQSITTFVTVRNDRCDDPLTRPLETANGGRRRRPKRDILDTEWCSFMTTEISSWASCKRSLLIRSHFPP